MLIRLARPEDTDPIGRIVGPVVRQGETYALPRSFTDEEAAAYWTGPDREAFVAEDGGEIIGTYYLRANERGGGSHVANAGYVTSSHAAGKGVARQMAAHSFQAARQRGFKAMQFNFVIASNDRAVALWVSLGFSIVGRLPKAFAHPAHGYVDALVMYRAL